MPRCCGGASCACLIYSSGEQISITGSGQASDPYIIHGAVTLAVTDNQTFNLTLGGMGTPASPWILGVAYAASAKLDDLPDVNAPTPSNGQVLGWDAPTSKWTPRAPTTASSGSVQHDTSLAGDGSAGTPLQVSEDADGFLATGASGLGLSDTGKNRIVRHYPNAATRDLTTPVPDLNTLSMLDTVPGRVDYWTGTAWAQQVQFPVSAAGGALMPLSGEYVPTLPVGLWMRNISATTDTSGLFDLLSTADLSGKAGVLGLWFQPTQSTVFTVIVETWGTSVRGHAYKLTDGSEHAGQVVEGLVLAFVY